MSKDTTSTPSHSLDQTPARTWAIVALGFLLTCGLGAWLYLQHSSTHSDQENALTPTPTATNHKAPHLTKPPTASTAPAPPPSQATQAQSPPSLFKLLPPHRHITEPAVLKLYRQALAQRQAQQPTESLLTLQLAREWLPDHPAILHEIAYTHQQLGQTTQALNLWKDIHARGEADGGDYHALAEIALDSSNSLHLQNTAGGEADRASPSLGSLGPLSSLAPGHTLQDGQLHPLQSAFQIGDVQAENLSRDLLEAHRLLIPLRLQLTQLDPSLWDNITRINDQLEIYVFFFDQTLTPPQRGSIELGQDLKTTYTWQSLPINWKAGGALASETMQVEVQRPQSPTPNRQLYGYIIKVYFQNQLQDVFARPRNLVDLPTQVPSMPPLPSQLNHSLIEGL